MKHIRPTGPRADRPVGPAFASSRLVLYIAFAGALLDQLLR